MFAIGLAVIGVRTVSPLEEGLRQDCIACKSFYIMVRTVSPLEEDLSNLQTGKPYPSRLLTTIIS